MGIIRRVLAWRGPRADRGSRAFHTRPLSVRVVLQGSVVVGWSGRGWLKLAMATILANQKSPGDGVFDDNLRLLDNNNDSTPVMLRCYGQ